MANRPQDNIRKAILNQPEHGLPMSDVKKEYLGTVTTSKGKFDVYMPTIGDVFDCPVGKNPMIWAAAKAIDIPFDSFSEWNMNDALKVINLISDGMTKL